MGPLTAGGVPLGHNVSSTVWPFHSPEYSYCDVVCDKAVVVVLGGTVVVGTEEVVEDGMPVAAGAEEVVDGETTVMVMDDVLVVDTGGAD